MSHCPKVYSNVDVNLAGGGPTMSVGSLWPVQLGIGGDKVEYCVDIAPLQMICFWDCLKLPTNIVGKVTLWD